MFLKHSSFNLFEDAAMELNCKSSFLYCTWYCSADNFHVPNSVAKTRVKTLHDNLKFSLVHDCFEESSPDLCYIITHTLYLVQI